MHVNDEIEWGPGHVGVVRHVAPNRTWFVLEWEGQFASFVGDESEFYFLNDDEYWYSTLAEALAA